MEKVTSSFLGLEPSTMTQTSYHFSPLLTFEFEVFGDVWLSLDKSIGEFSMTYKKKWVLWYGLGSIITISACN